MDINKLNFTTKITDSGATVNGRLSSDEFNLIPIKIDELVDDANTKTTNISDIETTANDAKDLATNAIDNFTKPKIESIFTGEISSHTHDNRYQQLESGKGLSANNFTDALLDKLNNLSNYEDTSLIERVVVIETWKTALTGTSTDEIINTFTEIVNFLSGITGTDSLTKVLSDMQTAIVNQIPTNNNLLTNGAEYQTLENVSSLITTALNNYLKTSDLADWVKTSEKPSYTQSEITDNVGIVVIKDLASTPTTTTLDDGNGYTFKVGDMIRVENSLSASGYYFYMLNKVVDSIATWQTVGGSTDVTNGSITEDKLSEDLKSIINSKYGYQRLETDTSGNTILLVFASIDDADLYDTDTTLYASLLLSSITLPSGGSSTGISYYIRCLNNLSSLNISVAKDDDCNINFKFISKYKYVVDTEYTNTDENGRADIYVKNSKYSDFTLLSTFEIASNIDKIYNIVDLIESGTNYVKVIVTGLNTALVTAALIYTVNVTSMSLSAPNFNWANPFIGNITMPFYISGNVSKTLIVDVTGDNYAVSYTFNIGTAAYTDTVYPNCILTAPTNEGVYNISAYLQNSDASVKTKAINWNIISISSGSTNKFLAINNLLESPINWSDNVLFYYTIYDGGSAQTDAIFTVKHGTSTVYESNNTEISTSVKNVFSLNLELDIADTSFDITLDITDSESTILSDQLTFTVNNAVGYSAVSGDIFYLNPRTRSNSQENKEKIVNSVDSSELTATWLAMSWIDDGWSMDADDNRLLRLMAGSSVSIPFQPFAVERALTGLSLEFDYKITNVTDYSKSILTIAKDNLDDTFVGLKIYPDNIIPCSSSLTSDDNLGIPVDDDVRLRVTVVLLPDAYSNSGFNLCMIYINGKRNRVFAYQSNDYWQADANIIIGNNYSDIDIYGIRVYYSSMSSSSVLKNFINWQSSTDNKALITLNNDVFDNDGASISFSEVKSKMNVFVLDQPFPNKTNPTNVTANFEVYFLNETTTRKNFSITNVTVSGQGTSSKKYYEWNEKMTINSNSVITYSDGSTGSSKVLLFDNVPKCSKITAKKNWASSMQDHKAGSVNGYTDLWRLLELSNEAYASNPLVRVTVYLEPFVAFYKYKAEDGVTDLYKCMGEFTMGPDKGDKYCFGYDNAAVTKLFSIEGSDNSPLHSLFRLPWNEDIIYNSTAEAFQYNDTNCWDLDSGSATNNSEWITAYNFVYNTSTLIKPFDGTLEELITAKEIYKLTGYQYWIAKTGDSNIYNLYYYDSKTDTFKLSINLYTQLVNLTFSYTDKDTTKTVNITDADLTAAIDNDAINNLFINARITLFGLGITTKFDLNDSLFHDCFIEFLAGTDNRAKNTYVYLMSEGGLFRWRQDDLDTIIVVDNEGKLHKPYWIEVHDKDTSDNNYWNGETSVFHNNLESAFPNAMKSMMHSMMDAMRTLGGLSSGTYREQLYAYYLKYYVGVKLYFPETIVNADQKRYDDAKLLDSSPVVDPLSQSLGDLYSCETSWFKKRIEYICSKYSYGEYSSVGTDVISFRGSGTMNFELTPALKLYPTVENGTSIVRGARTEAGQVCQISFVIEGGDQPVTIEGASFLMSIGDLSGKHIFGDMSISAKMLKELILGNATAENVIITITSLSLNNCPALLTLNILNVTSFVNTTLNLTTCSHLKECYANGTNFTLLILPTGTTLNYVHYPSTNKYLILSNMPVLSTEGVIISDCLELIIDLLVIECPNINSLTLLLLIMDAQLSQTNHILQHIRITGFDATYSDSTSGNAMLNRLLKLTDGTYYGLDKYGVASAENYPKPILEGSITVNANCYENTKDDLQAYFGSLLSLTITGKLYLKFADSAVEAICATNWGDGTGITKAECAVVSAIGSKFNNNTTITSFNELKYFTHITSTQNAQFLGCSLLHSIDLSNIDTISGVDGYHRFGFENCLNLENVIFKEGLIFLGFMAFYNCQKFNVKLSTSLKTILQNALRNTSYSWNIDFPNLETLGDGAFRQTKIERISNLGVLQLLGYSSDNYHEGPFENCPYLKYVELPATIISMGSRVFIGDTALVYVKLLAETPPTLYSMVFSNTNSTFIIYVPDASVDAYKVATGWVNFASRIKSLTLFAIDFPNG